MIAPPSETESSSVVEWRRRLLATQEQLNQALGNGRRSELSLAMRAAAAIIAESQTSAPWPSSTAQRRTMAHADPLIVSSNQRPSDSDCNRAVHSDCHTTRSTRDCSICLEPLVMSVVASPCAHLFHEHCLHRWIGVRATCPLCNTKL